MAAEGASAGVWRRFDVRARRDATGDGMVWARRTGVVATGRRCVAEAGARGWDAADDIGRAGDARRRAYWWWSGQQGCVGRVLAVRLVGVGGGDGDGDMVTPIGDSKTKKTGTAAAAVTA